MRLAALVDPAIGVLAEMVKSRKGRKDEARLKAALAILDRTGHHAKQDQEFTSVEVLPADGETPAKVIVEIIRGNSPNPDS